MTCTLLLTLSANVACVTVDTPPELSSTGDTAIDLSMPQSLDLMGRWHRGPVQKTRCQDQVPGTDLFDYS